MTATTRPREIRAALAAVVAALTVTAFACGSDRSDADVSSTPVEPSEITTTTPGMTEETPSEPTDSASPAAPPSTVEMSTTDLPTISGRPQTPPKGPTDTFQPFTTSGRVEAGAGPGCLELVTAAGRFVLLGDLVAELAAGDEVEIDALAAPNAVTTCQGDSVITVTAIRPS